MYCAACGSLDAAGGVFCGRCQHPLRVAGRYALVRFRELRPDGAERWDAQDTHTQEPFQGIVWTPAEPEGFEARLDLARGLSHRNLLATLGWQRAPRSLGPPRLVEVTEPEGTPLAALLRDGAPLHETRARGVLEGALGALEHLHGRASPLTHGGVSPWTLSVTPAGEVKLSGLAATVSGGVLGGASRVAVAVGYTAWELVAGKPSPASDLYALGVTLWALTSRRPPQEVHHAGQRPLYPDTAGLSPGLFAILHRMTDPEPSQRGSARWHLDALAALAGAPPRVWTRPVAEGFHGARVGRGTRRTPAEMSERGWSRDPRYLWPVDARASSTYGNGWDPAVTIGPPRVFPQHGDLQGAWAPLQPVGGVQWLELDYPEGAPPAEALVVFETLNPGALYAVTTEDDGAERILWQSEPGAVAAEARALEVTFERPEPLRRVRLWLDTRVTAGWNEIDTAALVLTQPMETIEVSSPSGEA